MLTAGVRVSSTAPFKPKPSGWMVIRFLDTSYSMVDRVGRRERNGGERKEESGEYWFIMVDRIG